MDAPITRRVVLLAALSGAAAITACTRETPEKKPAGPAPAAAPAPAAKPAKYAVGDSLRDATLVDLDGKDASLLALTRGKPAVINFFGLH